MKAFITLGDGIAALKIEERPIPQPTSNEILVKMTAASLNYRDLLVVNGVKHWKPAVPRVPVSDGVGIVMAIGSNVLKFKKGDHIAGIFLPKWLDGELTAEKNMEPLGGAAVEGVLSEYRIFDEQAVIKIPTHLTDVEAATLPVAGITAWHAVKYRSNVQPGESVLIQGTGGVSLFAMQFVHALGGLPIVTSSSDEKLEKVKELGASEVINYKKIPDWEKEVLRLTGGKGVDHVIEVVGGENLNRSLEAVKMSGTISFIGLIAGLSAPINTYQFVGKNIRLFGIETGSREMFEAMNRFLETHHIKPVLDKVFSFQDFAQGLAYLESGVHFGKVGIAF